MYFMLGNIAFEPVNLTDFNETHSADFAEHAVFACTTKSAAWKVVINRYFRQKPSKTPLP